MITRLTANTVNNNHYCSIAMIVVVIVSFSFLKTIFHTHQPFSKGLLFISKETVFHSPDLLKYFFQGQWRSTGEIVQ